MLIRLRRPITILAALALSIGLVVPVGAQSGAGFEMIQIQPTATLAGNNTIVLVYATYRCTFPAGGLSDAEDDYSGFGMSATQAQGKTGVVTGASGASAAMLTCDGTTQFGTFGVETGRQWKPGHVTFSMFVQFTEAVTHDVFRVDVPDTIVTIAAEKPAKPPKLTFSTILTDSDTPLATAPGKGFVLPTHGVAGMIHQLGTTNTKVNPGIPDGPYPFYLKASATQQAALTAYFAAKGWTGDLLDQSAKEVAGTAPYFDLVVGAGNGYFLEDGFHQALPIDPPMYSVAFGDDFPVGTYTFIGRLVGTNGATLDYTIMLTVKRLTPTLKFSTNLTDFDAPLAGTPAKGFVLPTHGVVGAIHGLVTTNTKVDPGIPDGEYPFYLKASPAQQAALTSYFAAKVWPPEDLVNWQDPGSPLTPQDLLDQSAREVAGTAPYLVLTVGAGNGWFLEDGFHRALPIEPPMYSVVFWDDFPVGTYTFTGHLVGTTGGTLDYDIILKVVRG